MYQGTIRLSNGLVVPRLALGTYLIPEEETAEAVRNALELGYRHIDTAQAYENEHGVGEGIRASSVPRDEIFVTSKVLAEIKNYDDAVRSIDESLRKAKLDRFDLMLIHCPQPWNEYG
ncbi:MAG: aldo/keto reductase, partial [Clostridia bacterium]|nr:aldo/keto reductase [Clostridia bacterium]